MKKFKKAISLVVLVVVIIVMVILTTTIILSISNTNIISTANEATFKTNIKTFVDEFETYSAFYIKQGYKLSGLNVSNSDIKSVITSMPDNYPFKDKFEIKDGLFMYNADLMDDTDVLRATWACDVGMQVEGVSCSDIDNVDVPKSSYERIGNVYYNTPDLTGFNLSKTYFVTYDENGNEIEGTNVLRTAPVNWHDYEHKMWANIVTKNDGLKMYLVWIPRYAYKVDSVGKVVDVRFVNKDNVYISPDGTRTTYSDTTPVFDENGNQTNWVVSSAFTVDMSDEGKADIELAGFWASKYEISDPGKIDFVETAVTADSIKVVQVVLDNSAKGNAGKIYNFYLDGTLVSSNDTGVYTFEGLTEGREYTVKVELSYGGVGYSEYTKKIVAINPNAPDLTGFDLTKTYYLTYDESNAEVRTPVMLNGVRQDAPSAWYDYSLKKWANIVVVNEDIGSELYLTWIPRYEYKVIDVTNYKGVDIVFISTSKVRSTPGYILSSAFMVDMSDENVPDDKKLIQLAGFWTSKYEISEVVTE